MIRLSDRRLGWLFFVAMAIVTASIYAPGLSGGFFFDDFPNIVDNKGIAIPDASLAHLVQAATSSPSSDLKRPLASLTFAINYLISGLDPFGMKLFNVVLHLLNGLLVFILSRQVLYRLARPGNRSRAGLMAAMVTGAWMLLPINLTSVLYVVQRMESLANLFVLIGLIAYVRIRTTMQENAGWGRFVLVVCSIVVPAGLGILAKETAIMLPLYAALTEHFLFHWRSGERLDRRIVALYVAILALPCIAGLAWILPHLLQPSGWSSRNYTLSERLFSEARIVSDYVAWTVVPTPGALSFYHDDFNVSRGLLSPWTTLAGILFLSGMGVVAFLARARQPLLSLGICLYLACHLLTGTILPLELVYEHRNYFASMGLMLIVVPAILSVRPQSDGPAAVRFVIMGALFVYWGGMTALTASAWGSQLGQAEELAARAPRSPRAQYELGRTYIILSKYDPASPFTPRVYAPLERSAALPGSSILPEQALIFFNARMKRPIPQKWWDGMTEKLRKNSVAVQDESALGALTQCTYQGLCHLPPEPLLKAYLAALSHPAPTARLVAMYSDFAWNVLQDKPLGERMAAKVIRMAPSEPAYYTTHIRMLVSLGRIQEARDELALLEKLNVAGMLDHTIQSLQTLTESH